MKRLVLAALLIVAGLVLLRLHGHAAPHVASGGDPEFHVSVPVPPTVSTSNQPTAPSTSVTTLVQDAGLANTDSLERKSSLVEHLPRTTPHYSIDYSVGTDGRLNLKITLIAVLNRADQLAQYRADLKTYKAEALAWIASQGATLDSYNMAWLPPEAEGV